MKNIIDCIKYDGMNKYVFDSFEDFCKKYATIDCNHISYKNSNRMIDIAEDAYIDTFFEGITSCSFTTYQEYLFETLTRSYDLGKLFETLASKYKNARFCLRSTTENEGFINNLLGRQKRYNLHIMVQYNKRKIDLINDKSFKSLLNLYNCFVTRKSENDAIVEFYIEQVYTNDVTTQTYKENRFLYHITSLDKYSKIRKYGLFAKEGHRDYFNHPARIYVLREDTKYDELKRFAEKLYPDKDYVVLRIDLKKIKTPRNEKLRFYVDPAYGNTRKGLYTLGPILPSCIEEIDVDKL